MRERGRAIGERRGRGQKRLVLKEMGCWVTQEYFSRGKRSGGAWARRRCRFEMQLWI